MEYRFLVKTGLKVSEICFGPGNNNVSDEREGMRMIEAAFDMGITLYDTANFEKKGKVEEWLGKVFTDRRVPDPLVGTQFRAHGRRGLPGVVAGYGRQVGSRAASGHRTGAGLVRG